MELYRELLSRRHLSVISAVSDHELDSIAGTVVPSYRVHDRSDLEELFGQWLAAPEHAAATSPRTLDLIGHSTSTSLLRLGNWVLDAASPCVVAFFRGLADNDVLPRLQIGAVRLLACRTASTAQARATLCTLADILGVEVLGTEHLLCNQHYDAAGFRGMWEFMLVSDRELRRVSPPAPTRSIHAWPRTLDIDALPAQPLQLRAVPWPQRVANENAVREILRLIRRNAGARMPGLTATPSCELALPSVAGGQYHLMHVLFDGAFVRCFPDGEAVSGIVYPVEDAPRLHRIVNELPLLVFTR